MTAVKCHGPLTDWTPKTNVDNLADRVLGDVLYAGPLSIFDGYCKMEECIKFSLIGKHLPSKIMTQSIKTASKKDITHFVSDVRKKAVSDEEMFKKMILLFFQYAPTSAHAHFFSTMTDKDGDFLTQIIAELPQDLSHLNLTHCKGLKDRHVKLIAERLDKLDSLNLSNCRAITNAAVNTIVCRSAKNKLQNSVRFKSLNFSHCKNITNLALIKISGSRSMIGLQSLKFAGCHQITNEGVEALIHSTYLPILTSLNLRGCRQVTPEARALIAKILRQNALKRG